MPLTEPPVAAHPVHVVPERSCVDLLLTALDPIHHGDPGGSSESNIVNFRRVPMLVQRPSLQVVTVDPAVLLASLDALKYPGSLAPVVQGLGLGEFVGVAFLRVFIRASRGQGLMKAVSRYRLLAVRARGAAMRSSNLRDLWGQLAQVMETNVPNGAFLEPLMSLWSLPAGAQALAIAALSSGEGVQPLLAIARSWAKAESANDPAPAPNDQLNTLFEEDEEEDAGPVAAGQPVAYRPNLEEMAEHELAPYVRVEVPTISANAIRHTLVREPLRTLMLDILGFRPGTPGFGELPAGVDALLQNGGNIKHGSKSPNSRLVLGSAVRDRYPSIDLVSGCADSFLLGRGRLSVSTHIVCRETKPTLEALGYGTLPGADMPADSMVTVITNARAAGPADTPMLFTHEHLVPGTQFLVRLAVAPGTRDLTRGALYAALDRWHEQDGHMGGLSASGRGSTSMRKLSAPGDWTERKAEFLAYLQDNRDALALGLRNGTLGTETVLVS